MYRHIDTWRFSAVSTKNPLTKDDETNTQFIHFTTCLAAAPDINPFKSGVLNQLFISGTIQLQQMYIILNGMLCTQSNLPDTSSADKQ
jgi:hypothetical protein